MNFDSLSVGQTVGRVASVFWSRKVVFWKIAACAVFPLMILTVSMQAVVAHIFADVINEINRKNEDMISVITDVLNEVANKLPVVFVLMLLYLLLSTVVGVIGSAAMIRVAAEAHVDRDSLWLGSLRKGMENFGSLFCAGFLMAMGYSLVLLAPLMLMSVNSLAWLGMLLGFFMPMILFYISVRLYTVYAVIVVEKASAMQGIARAWSLSGGAFCHFFCASLVFGILQGVIFYVLNVALMGGSAFKPAGIILGALCQQLPNFVFLPCFSILQTSLYLSRRIETEQFTKDDLARELVSEEDDMATPLLAGDVDSEADTENV